MSKSFSSPIVNPKFHLGRLTLLAKTGWSNVGCSLPYCIGGSSVSTSLICQQSQGIAWALFYRSAVKNCLMVSNTGKLLLLNSCPMLQILRGICGFTKITAVLKAIRSMGGDILMLRQHENLQLSHLHLVLCSRSQVSDILTILQLCLIDVERLTGDRSIVSFCLV